MKFITSYLLIGWISLHEYCFNLLSSIKSILCIISRHGFLIKGIENNVA